MIKRTLLILFIIICLLNLTAPQAGLTQKKVEVNFFYSRKCHFCQAEQKFLDELETKYPEIIINRYPIDEPENIDLLKQLAQKCDAEKYLGLVPLTFISENFFLGFDNPANKGREIETAIKEQIKGMELSSCPPSCSCNADDAHKRVSLPFIGEVNVQDYSLPTLTLVLGTLDGFNVCSVGALVLILGLVLALRSRKKILIFGGLFILTTTIVYGLLIVLWHQIFAWLSSYFKIMELLIGGLGIGGGIYFLKQFIKFKKQGPTCDIGPGQKIMAKFSVKLKESLGRPGNVLLIIGSVLLFAAVITIVEFPCSAVVPVVYVGTLVKANLSISGYLFYIALYLLFYMLDEIIVFLVACFKMSIWLTSNKFVTWMTLAGSIILFLLGFYYLIEF